MPWKFPHVNPKVVGSAVGSSAGISVGAEVGATGSLSDVVVGGASSRSQAPHSVMDVHVRFVVADAAALS